MSIGYFDDPQKKDAWEKEINQMRQEKNRRKSGKQIQKENGSTRVPITYNQLVEQEYGRPKPQKLSISVSRQLEKNKEMGGKNL